MTIRPKTTRITPGRASIVVHKFGGAALADAAAIRHAAGIIGGRRERGKAVVASAMLGVTDELLAIAMHQSQGKRRTASAAAARLRQRHIKTADALAIRGAPADALRRTIDHEFAGLAAILATIAADVPLSATTSDAVLAHGERVAAHLVAAALTAEGMNAEVVDAMRIVHAQGPHGGATPDFERTARAASKYLLPILRRRTIPVVPGFIGRGPDGAVVTLGRGGSDLTATVLGRALGAASVTLWKDVPGVLTADPRIVREARQLPRLHVREAAELAYYGAKVLHPRALLGLGPRTRLFIRPVADPTAAGTEISTRRDALLERRYPVRALTTIGGQAIITVSGDGMVGVPGIAARAFGALERVGVSVSLISQASSEHSICLVVPGPAAAAARAALTAAFAAQLAHREVESIDVRMNAAILAVVGLGMMGTPGIAARLFGAIADVKASVIAIAQGASELNISVVVDERSIAKVQRAVHAAFRLDKIGGGAADSSLKADVVILGYGRIGRELAAQLAAVKGPRGVRVVAIVDRSGYVFDPRGLSARRLASLAAAKAAGGALADVARGVSATAEQGLAEVRRHALTRPILVDVTAGDTGDVLEAALRGGMDIVLANKRPLAARQKRGAGLVQSAAASGRRLLHEATVGAGLPIIDTIRKLHESGDEVLGIEGCPSGTLGYLFGELGRGVPFSVALRAAMSLGYTEPDPREDLSGMDVARKALILGRLLGFKGELDEVEVESLVPEPLREVPAAEFVARLEELDRQWHARVDDAKKRDTVLRYRATVSGASVRVGLVGVHAASSFAALTGTDNQFAITTTRYRDNPLVITGPGAGVAVTAAGVLNDVLQLAGSR